MRTALRLGVCGMMALVASLAFARGPASNGCGDGEANVPFAALVQGADELGGGSGEPGMIVAALPIAVASPASNGLGDGEANVPFATMAAAGEELGGGSGEPGLAPAEDAAVREAIDRALVIEVWTAP